MKKTLLITFLMGVGAMALAQPAGRQLWNKDWTFHFCPKPQNLVRAFGLSHNSR